MPPEGKELYEFDKFRLDVSERILWCANERIPLSEKAFDTLRTLLRVGNRLVSKDDLLNEVWADAIVEENNLDKNISILRQALGERAGKGKFIETVRGHGFRFVPKVRKVDDSEDPDHDDSKVSETVTADDSLSAANPSDVSPPSDEPKIQSSRRYVLIAVLGIFILALGLFGFYSLRKKENATGYSFKTMAVLPFKSISPGNRDEERAMGIADALIARLGGGDITVRQLSSVAGYDTLEQDALQAGRELEVETVLDGTIQTSGDTIRVTARLLRVTDGKQLWMQRFETKSTDVFALQDKISEQVATAFKFSNNSNERKHYTESFEAYELYQKGLFYLYKPPGPDNESVAISYFQKAIEADPNYALAYAGLAGSYRRLVIRDEVPSSDLMPKSIAAAKKAIEIDNTLAEGHASLAYGMFWKDWDWAGAEKEYKRALELDPDNSDTLLFYAQLLSSSGRHGEAIDTIERARKLDPVNLKVTMFEGLLLIYAGRNDEAITRLQETIALDSEMPASHGFLGRAYIEKGMFDEALTETNRARDLAPRRSAGIVFVVCALARSGKIAEARASLDELLEISKARSVPPYFIALVYNAVGENEKALDYLEKALAEKDGKMVFLNVEPEWKTLRSEPRFQQLLQKMNL